MALMNALGIEAKKPFDENISAGSLGSNEFRIDYGIKYAYLVGGMFKGIASKEMIVALGKAGLMGYLGAGGLKFEKIESDIQSIRRQLPYNREFGVNVLYSLDNPESETKMIDLLLASGVRYIEAAAYMQVTANLVRYRLSGATRNADGKPHLPNHVLAKVSRPEVAAMFMSPPPETIVQQLVAVGSLSSTEAAIAPEVPVAGEICVESDSAGHTDQRVAFTLIPAMLRLGEKMMEKYKYARRLKIGAAGGIGTPEAAGAAFILGADFVLTGSINQCTVEAATSVKVKDMLQTADVQDTTYAPAGDMFELGSKVQVLKKGLFFAARANKLYDLYCRYNSIDELDEKIQNQIQKQFFRRSFQEVWEETKAYYIQSGRRSLTQLEGDQKQKMALIFRWYFVHSTRLAMNGSDEQVVDYQIHCGPAMGAFNQWVKGSELESWKNRRVADIADKIMIDTADFLDSRLKCFVQNGL